jgi:thioredoxin-like negative regulator of GroEL
VQAPILERLARQYTDRLVVLGINVGESPGVAAGYARSKGLSYPILADAEGETAETYRASSLPTVVLVDRQGKLVSLTQGVTRQATLEQALARLW